MNLVDVVVLGVAAFSGLLGFLRGFVREVFGLAAWLGAGFAAWWFGPDAAAIAHRYITNPDFAEPVALGAIFLPVLIVLTLVAGSLGGAIRRSALGGLDRTFGLVYGVARGGAIAVAAYVLASVVQPPDQWPGPVLEARSLPAIYTAAAWAAQRLPNRYRPELPAPPVGRPTSSAELLHANPVGRANAPPPARP